MPFACLAAAADADRRGLDAGGTAGCGNCLPGAVGIPDGIAFSKGQPIVAGSGNGCPSVDVGGEWCCVGDSDSIVCHAGNFVWIHGDIGCRRGILFLCVFSVSKDVILKVCIADHWIYNRKKIY